MLKYFVNDLEWIFLWGDIKNIRYKIYNFICIDLLKGVKGFIQNQFNLIIKFRFNFNFN